MSQHHGEKIIICLTIFLMMNIPPCGQGTLQWCASCHTDHPDTAAEDCSTYKVRQMETTGASLYTFFIYFQLGTAVGGDYGLWQNPEP